jgi:hypothetical protein
VFLDKIAGNEISFETIALRFQLTESSNIGFRKHGNHLAAYRWGIIMVKKISAARKAAESTIKHEDLVDAIENLGKKNGLDIRLLKVMIER